MQARLTAITKSNDFLWMSLALLALITLALLLPVPPNDYWWYMRIGQDVLRTGQVPVVDTLSFTQAGGPVVYQSWLSSVFFWLVYRTGGLPLTVFLRGAVIALTFGMFFHLMRKTGVGPKLALILTLVVGIASTHNWSIRPQMLAYPLFILSLWLLWLWQEGQTKAVWWLPLIALLWANLHGSFVLLFALIGAALVFGKGQRKTLAIIFGAAILITLVNPRGVTLWKDVVGTFTSTTQARNFSVEWKPPSNQDWQMNIFFGWLLLFGLLTALSPRRLNRLEWVWFLGFGWLALSGVRYVIWFLFILGTLTAALLVEFDRRWLDRGGVRTAIPTLNYILGCLFLLMPLSVLPGVREQWWQQSPPVLSENTPLAATEWLSENPTLPGPMWADISFSSYLIFALPSRPVWIDPRFQVAYPADQIERYLVIVRAQPDWEQELDRDGINLLFLSVRDQPVLLPAVENSSQWCERYRDKVAVIFVRKAVNQSC
jgi:hypothetical protein